MELIKIGSDYNTLPDELMDAFKQHLRILHNHEDDSIKRYLAGAIDAIGILAGTEVFDTAYEVMYLTPTVYEYRYPSTIEKWYVGKWNISNVVIMDGNGNDVSANYTVDGANGFIYPHPVNNKVLFNTGFDSADKIPPNLVNIIFRLAADYFENREANRVGDPKALPGWVNHALASIWAPRI